VPIDATIGIHVYRVLQEALSNVARHSGTDRAIVRLHVEPGALTLEVQDRGRGLLAESARSRGLGLVAMRERAELVNGTIELLSPSGGGTLIRLKVPLSEIAEAHASALRADPVERRL